MRNDVVKLNELATEIYFLLAKKHASARLAICTMAELTCVLLNGLDDTDLEIEISANVNLRRNN